MSVCVTVEAGVNHNGSLESARRFSDPAKKAGADCVKFRTFIPKNRVNVLVIGLGSMGKRRIRILRGILNGGHIFGVDTSRERCAQAEDLYNVMCFNTLDEALKCNTYEAAFVCTPPLTHFSVSRRVLEMGIHVFSEINLIRDGYDELAELANRQKVVYFLSSTPMYRAEMELIHAVTRHESSITYNYHVGQYLPDWHPWESYAGFFAGDKRTNGCREIFAIELPWMMQAFGEIIDVQVSRKHSTDLTIQYDDTYIVILTHARGNTGVFCVDVCCRKPVRHLELYNQNLYITWDGTPDSLYSFDIETNIMRNIEISERVEPDPCYAPFVNEDAYFKEVLAFLACIDGQDVPMYTLEKDKKTLEMIDRIEGLQGAGKA